MIDRDRIHRILVVALDNLGDLVFASALVPPLREAFPHARIDVWSKSYTEPVARLIDGVDDVVAADPCWATAKAGPRPPIAPFVRSIAALRRRHYDVALLSGSPWRTAAAVSLAKIPLRIGLARGRNHRFLTHTLAAEDARKPILLEQARLLAPLGVISSEPRYTLDPERLGPLRESVRAQLPERFAALHPFAGARDRCVPLHEWTALAGALNARGLATLWIGTSQELTEIRRSPSVPEAYFADALGDHSLAVSAAALSLATLFVGHDSGPLHVAGAFGVPVIGVFAPGQPERTFPQGKGPSTIISQPSPQGISADTILRAVDALGVFSAT
jgi:ADP-heptose:LPS heptosyltransferase